MSKTYAWNFSFESSPSSDQSVGLGDDRIRELKVAIRERLETDHYFGDGNSDDEGKHNSIRFREQPSDPSTGATELALYVKDDGGTPELFLRRESDGTEYQATFSGGGIGFPSGTKMLFYQASAPPGWSIDSSFTDGTLPYIDNANGGTAKSGGTWTISGLSDSGHTHDAGTYVASHNHQWIDWDGAEQHGWNSGGTEVYFGAGVLTTSKAAIRAWNGTDGILAASYYTAITSASVTGSSASGTASIASDASWRPPGYNFIVCEKD